MRVLCTKQRTDEWLKVKRGVISASDAHVALMGRGTKTRRLYVERLANGLEGVPDFDAEDDQPWFVAGRYYESWAIGWYSFNWGVDVTHTGFVVHDDYSFIGCSPDGLVNFNTDLEVGDEYRPSGTEGLVEAKFRKKISTFKKHAAAEALDRAVRAQVQTQMLVTGCLWCDYLNYWRDDANGWEKGHVQRVFRDEAYINQTLLPAFIGLWEQVQAEVREPRLRQISYRT